MKKKIINKNKVIDGYVKKTELKKLLNEQTKVILEAVNEIVERKVNDGVRQSTAYTELRMDEVIGIMKNDRQIYKERFEKIEEIVFN